jgi:hypothetical protein
MTMPSSINPGEISELVLRLHALGIDNINLWVNENRTDCCDVGWNEIKVRGIGLNPAAAIEDAERKLRIAIAETHPEVELPPAAE